MSLKEKLSTENSAVIRLLLNSAIFLFIIKHKLKILRRRRC